MRTLLMIYRSYTEAFAFCPLCKKKCDDVETDDYVGSNMLIWCKTHGEILICPTGSQDEEGEFNYLEKGMVKRSCSILLTKAELINSGFDLSDLEFPIDDYYAYIVGVLHLSDIYSTSDDPPDSHNYDYRDRTDIPYHSVDAYSFSQIQEDLNTAHDGIYLYYKGKCSECGKEYADAIWGD